MSRLNGEATDNFIRAQARYTLAKLDYDYMVSLSQTHVPEVVSEYHRAVAEVRAAAEELLVR